MSNTVYLYIQEALEKCWAHSSLRAATRRLFYIAIHQVSLLLHAATVGCRQNWSFHCGDVAIFRIFKMATTAILVF